MQDIIIDAQDIHYAYPDLDENPENDVAALDGLSAKIERGKFTAIIGHNGSGKSTLAKLLSAILVPDSGKVLVYKANDSEGILSSDEDKNFEIRKSVGMVFQNPDNQLVATIVEDDVAFAPENLGIEPAEIRKRVDASLETVGLSEYAEHDTHKLSGGQKQRVAIAGMLAMNPECVIFDESTAMLDPQGRKDIMNTIHALGEKGITVVLISHYMNEAAQADTIILVDHGKVVMTGTPREIFAKHELLKSCGLEAPQATMLVQRLSEIGLDISVQGVLDAKDAAMAIKAALDKKNAGNV